jgi:hypothetical protein
MDFKIFLFSSPDKRKEKKRKEKKLRRAEVCFCMMYALMSE